MSFDVYIGTPACDHCGRGSNDICAGNYTANMGGYFRWALSDDGEPHPDDIGRSDSRDAIFGNRTIEGGIPGLDGMTAADVIPMVDRAIMRTEGATMAFLKSMNASNGWGDCMTACAYLLSIRDACIECPEGTIRVSM